MYSGSGGGGNSDQENSNKRAKHEFMQFKGRKGPRLGDEFQVGDLPTPAKATEAKEFTKSSPEEEASDDGSKSTVQKTEEDAKKSDS